MAYCNECGAYIPDGHTKCLACGYDAAEAEKKSKQESAQAQAYDYKYEEPKRVNTDFLREQLEQQRKRQQENSRKWAETEKAQRERAKSQSRSYSSNNATRSTDTKKYTTPSNVDSSKVLSALSYFGILFVLPYLLCQNDDFAKFHAKQGMILFLAGIIAKTIASILGLGWAVSLAKIYFIYKGVTNVLNGKREPLPYIGTLI